MTTIAADHMSRTVKLLLRDVEATLGSIHEPLVRHHAANVAQFAREPAQFMAKLVEDVQQEFHDCFINTTWPSCPRHPNHPMWLRGEEWYCERDGEPIAKLGELPVRSG